jgi:broad specificity phosphatase PhoE
VTALYLVRHGQASFGGTDYDRLSEVGQRQCALLGNWWKRTGVGLDAVATGSQRRHRQSAEACLQALGAAGIAPQTDPALDEYDHDEVLRRHRPDLGDAAALQRFLAREKEPRRAFHRIFAAAVERWVGGAHDADYREPWPAFRARCADALQALALRAKGEGRAATAVFTSGGPITVACQVALGIPDARILDLNWSLLNAGVTQVRARSTGLRLAHFNSVAHLDVACDASLITYR